MALRRWTRRPSPPMLLLLLLLLPAALRPAAGQVACAAATCAYPGCAPGAPCSFAASCACSSKRCAFNVTAGANECLPPLCSDNLQNGFEPATDCGGGCRTCVDGSRCYVGGDCGSGICANLGAGTPATCRAPSCLDEVANGAEADIDCGTACCDATLPGALCTSMCVDGYTCASPADCTSGRCFRNPTLGVKYCVGARVTTAEPDFSSRVLGALRIVGARKRGFDAAAFVSALAFFVDAPPEHVKLEALTDVQAPPQWGAYALAGIRAANNGTVSVDPLSGQVTYGVAAGAGRRAQTLPPIVPTYWITTVDTVVALDVRFSVYARPDEVALFADRVAGAVNGSGTVLAGGWALHRSLVRNATRALDTAWYCAGSYNATTGGAAEAYASATGVDCGPFVAGGANEAAVGGGPEGELGAQLPEVLLGLNRSSDGALEAAVGRGWAALTGGGGGRDDLAALAAADGALWLRRQRRRLDTPAPASTLLTQWRAGDAAGYYAAAAAGGNGTNATHSALGFNPWVSRVSALPRVAFLPVLAGWQATPAVAAAWAAGDALEPPALDAAMDAPTATLFPARLSVVRQPRGTAEAPLYGGFHFPVQPWVAFVDAHERVVTLFTQAVVVTASLDAAVFPPAGTAGGGGGAGIVLTGAVSVTPDIDGVARFADLGLSDWPNGTGPVTVYFASTYKSRASVAAPAVPLAGATEPFVVLRVPDVVLPVVPRTPLSPYAVAAILVGSALVVVGAAAAGLRAARSLGTPVVRAAMLRAAGGASGGSGRAAGTADANAAAAAVAAGDDGISYVPAVVRFVRGDSAELAAAAAASNAATAAAHEGVDVLDALDAVRPPVRVLSAAAVPGLGPDALVALWRLDAALCGVEGRVPGPPPPRAPPPPTLLSRVSAAALSWSSRRGAGAPASARGDSGGFGDGVLVGVSDWTRPTDPRAAELAERRRAAAAAARHVVVARRVEAQDELRASVLGPLTRAGRRARAAVHAAIATAREHVVGRVDAGDEAAKAAVAAAAARAEAAYVAPAAKSHGAPTKLRAAAARDATASRADVVGAPAQPGITTTSSRLGPGRGAGKAAEAPLTRND